MSTIVYDCQQIKKLSDSIDDLKNKVREQINAHANLLTKFCGYQGWTDFSVDENGIHIDVYSYYCGSHEEDHLFISFDELLMPIEDYKNKLLDERAKATQNKAKREAEEAQEREFKKYQELKAKFEPAK